MKKYILFLGVVLGFLAYTNPNMDDFAEFARDRSQEAIQAEVGDTAIGRALAEFGSSLANDFAGDLTERKNYVVCSIYQVGDGDDPWSFLGVAGRFIRLGGPKSNSGAD